MSKEERLVTFQYHAVPCAVAEEMALIREHYYEVAELVHDLCPYNRSQSLALTALEESLMRAIQSLAVGKGTQTPIGTVHSGLPETP